MVLEILGGLVVLANVGVIGVAWRAFLTVRKEMDERIQNAITIASAHSNEYARELVSAHDRDRHAHPDAIEALVERFERKLGQEVDRVIRAVRVRREDD